MVNVDEDDREGNEDQEPADEAGVENGANLHLMLHHF